MNGEWKEIRPGLCARRSNAAGNVELDLAGTGTIMIDAADWVALVEAVAPDGVVATSDQSLTAMRRQLIESVHGVAK